MAAENAGFSGYTELSAALRRAGPNAMRALASALYVEGQKVLRVSQSEVPIGSAARGDKHPGTLRASGHVSLPVITGMAVEVTIGYGGAAKAYAVVQHEREDYRHDPGRKAHYLSDPMKAALPSLEIHLAERLLRSGFLR